VTGDTRAGNDLNLCEMGDATADAPTVRYHSHVSPHFYHVPAVITLSFYYGTPCSPRSSFLHAIDGVTVHRGLWLVVVLARPAVTRAPRVATQSRSGVARPHATTRPIDHTTPDVWPRAPAATATSTSTHMRMPTYACHMPHYARLCHVLATCRCHGLTRRVGSGRWGRRAWSWAALRAGRGSAEPHACTWATLGSRRARLLRPRARADRCQR